MKFEELTQTALLGTERQAGPIAGDASLLGALLAQLDAKQPEASLLSAAAICGSVERAGADPARDFGAPPAPCPAEMLPRMSARAGSLLARLLDREHEALFPEFLTLAAEAGRVALPEALPAILVAGAAKASLRESLIPILGERGRWLAAQNPSWSWWLGADAENDDDNVWRLGNPAARLTLLQTLRRANPARSRELLGATWKEESPDDRARFIAALATGLGPEDEPFLDAALDDKRKDVRQAAAKLLGRLPESAFVKRMTARAKPLVKLALNDSKARKRKDATLFRLELELPTECDAAMRRDGIEPAPPQGFGERAWWLAQMLESVPLSLWGQDSGAGPEEVIAASLASEWSKELFEAWVRAAIRQNNADWAAELFDIARQADNLATSARLVAALPAEQRELKLATLLQTAIGDKSGLALAALEEARHDWSPAFSRAVVAWFRAIVAQTSTDWQTRDQLENFVPRLAPATLQESSLGWPTESPGWEFWSKGVDKFLAALQFRADTRASFAPDIQKP